VLAQPTGTGAAHPTPDTVPARKSSIIQGVAGQGGHHQVLHWRHSPPFLLQGLMPGQPMGNPAVTKLL
jgi:hypothetical protein